MDFVYDTNAVFNLAEQKPAQFSFNSLCILLC